MRRFEQRARDSRYFGFEPFSNGTFWLTRSDCDPYTFLPFRRGFPPRTRDSQKLRKQSGLAGRREQSSAPASHRARHSPARLVSVDPELEEFGTALRACRRRRRSRLRPSRAAPAGARAPRPVRSELARVRVSGTRSGNARFPRCAASAARGPPAGEDACVSTRTGTRTCPSP